MPKGKNAIPKLYCDDPGTVVKPLGNGYESVQRPDGSTVVRKALSASGKLKHERAQALATRGWQVKRFKGVGCVVHPKHPNVVNASIAAAAVIEFGPGGKPPTATTSS